MQPSEHRHDRRLPSPDRDTEGRILDAARRVFVRRGTSGARVQEIAAEAGVNQALVHYYFGSKDALAERVFREAIGGLARGIARLADTGRPFEALIGDFVAHYIDTVRRAPFLPAYVLAEAHQHPERLESLFTGAIGHGPADLVSRFLAHLDGIIAERVADGRMRPMTPRMLLSNVMALCAFPFAARPVLTVAFRMDDDDFEAFLDERKRELPTFILNALRP